MDWRTLKEFELLTCKWRYKLFKVLNSCSAADTLTIRTGTCPLGVFVAPDMLVSKMPRVRKYQYIIIVDENNNTDSLVSVELIGIGQHPIRIN